MGIFVRFFADGNFCEVLLVAEGFILFSLHMTVVWDPLMELESRHRATPLMFA